MSGRTSSRRRSKTQRLIDSEELELTPPASASRAKRSVPKPKYVETVDRSETPTSSRSRLSTPASSRATSRSPTPTKSSKKKKKSPPAKTSAKAKKTPKAVNGRNSGSATPLSRGASRSSSVSSRKAPKVSTQSPKVKTKLGRGYNPNLVNYKESEYHYGSDFEESEDDHVEYDDVEEKESESSEEESSNNSDSDDLAESDVDWDAAESGQSRNALDGRSVTPIPFWLKTEDEENVPELKLPKSSDDLLIDANLAFQAAGIYEILRHYYLLLRLSLFRFEDFCAALASEEQSNLLSEVHIALLKAIIRAEEKDNTNFGPMDHKDSINALFFFMDTITWPDAMRQYLGADTVVNAEPLAILNEYPEYPVAKTQINSENKSYIQARIQLLNFLADQFLTTSAVRDDIVNEGALAQEDHCRICHRLGDLIVCEMCNGSYHPGCLDPPLDEVPEYDWQCYVCQAHQVEGVIDCVDEAEKSGLKIRHQALGFDRAGNKYWWIVRRIFIEESGGQIRYYTSVPQFEDLLEQLDSRYFEADVCGAIEADRSEIERQMGITEKLTSELKANNRKSYLELENQTIVKTQEEKQEQQMSEERERREAADAIIRQAKEEEDAKRQAEEEERQRKEDEKRRERESRLRKREESRGDGFQVDDTVVKEEEVPMDTSEEVVSQAGDIKEEEDIKDEKPANVKSENSSGPANKQTIIVKPPPEAVLNNEPVRMTRRTVQEINQGTLFFKLGQEGNYKSYINQFTTNPSALTKVQANEERNKRTHMSHKFSLTDVSTFRWMGQLHGTRHQLVNTLRQTMLQLENNVPSIFMHANWAMMRKPWIQALNTSQTPKDFARALTVLQCCFKPSIMVNIWYDSLGHTQLKKITQQMKDDKKKMEKRERKDAEEEFERLRPFYSWVKYTLGLKHQVSKQKGEEYRAHGQLGWLWLSSARRFTPTDARKVGLRAGPHRLAVKYTDMRANSYKIVLMEPKAFKYLLAKQESMGKENQPENNPENQENQEKEKSGLEKKKLEQALKNAKLEHQVADEELFKNTVDISAGLSNPTRVCFTKVAKKAKYLDDFLARRCQLKSLEERRIQLKLGNKPEAESTPVAVKKPEVKKEAVKNESADVDVEGESDTQTIITSDLAEKTTADKERDAKKFVENAKKSVWSLISKLKEADKKVRPQHRPQDLKCYSATPCQPSTCYSVSCQNFKELCPIVGEASEMIKTTIEDGQKNHGLDLKGTLSKSASITEAVNVLQNLVKNLMKTKDEADNYESIGMSTVLNGEVKNGDDKMKEEEISQKDLEAKHNIVRVYSNADASGKLYLKRIQTVAESKKQNKIIKYPLAPSFYAASRKKRNILILAKHDVKRLARRAGLVTCEGFNYNAKNNNLVWPYPCPRPSFKTAWLYKTACLNSIQSVAMQLHVLWTCLRWDDMHTRPLAIEGKTQETTETAIITTEIVKARHIGRFQEITEYFRRRITIPLNVPSNKNADNTPIRSGLRKRKREEAPVQTEPELKEEWIPEDKLELHEIRGYHERLERDRNAAVTRTRSGVGVREPQRLDPGHQESHRRGSDVNAANNVKTMNQNNRSVLHQNQTSPLTTISANAPGAPTIIRRIQNPDGTVTIMKTVMNAPNQSRMVQSTPPAGMQQPQAKKVFISKDGKIIGAQLLQQPQTSTTGGGSPATTKISIPSVGGVSNPVATPTIVQPHQIQQQQQSPQTQQKVQIVRSSDGKIQVRGLLPGQQLVQMPDGKLQIFSQPTPGQPAVQATIPQPTVQTTVQQSNPVQMPVQVQTPTSTVQQSSRIVVHPNGATTTTASNQTTPKIVTPGSGNKSIVATPLQPGQSIPPGTTVFMSGGKTYCIPKATMTVANQQTNQTTTPALPSTPVPPQQLTPATPATPTATPVAAPPAAATSAPTTPTIGTVQSQTTTGQKQMVEVKSLGQNTVTFKGQQMIVSGPDIAQAQLIAKQLSSGAAKLATLNGKQVLISTQPTAQQQQQQATINKTVTTTTATATTSATIQASPTVSAPTPSAAAPTTSAIPNNVKLPSEPLPPASVVKSPEKTVENPSPVLPQTATAQFIQTPQGPRIVLHGIQGANLTPEQLSNVQQQVKEQLLKAQAEAKKAGTVPPTKIQINLPQTTATKPAAATATPVATPAAAPATPVAATPTTVANSPTTRHIITTPTGQRVILMGSQNSGQKQLITVPHSTSMTPVTVTTASNAAEVIKPTVVNTTTVASSPATTQSLLMTSLIQPKTSTISTPNAGGASAIKAASIQSPDKFELTPDVIKQTIQTALKKDNLSPEIEQKLLALQEQHHDKSMVVLKKNQKLIDPASGEPMDDEWEGATYAERSLANKNRRKKQEEKVIAERVAQNAKTPSAAALARSQAMNKSQTPTSTLQQKIVVNNVQAEINDNEEKKVNVQQKLNLALLRHKEQLKRDISKKRKSMENEVKESIDEEIRKIKGDGPGGPPGGPSGGSPGGPPGGAGGAGGPGGAGKPASVTLVAGQPIVVNSVKKDEVSEEDDDYKPQPTLDHPPASILQNSYEVASTVETIPVNNVVQRSPSPTFVNNKRKRNDSSDNESNESSEGGTVLPPRNKKKRQSSGASNALPPLPEGVKREKLYCICKTPYDPKKFYVGCDVCSNWFHGSCVGITETMAKTMTEYICDECRNARDSGELYCICRQPYDETQFYIGCENCSDWFHGRCVGILQCEADRIEEYICPRCDPNSKLNVPNQKKLTAKDCEAIKRLVKQLLANRSSIPFQQPVDPNEVPNYYKVIKEPMDLSSVERKVNNGQYTKLCEFIGDVMRIFENCRFFNQPNTSIMKSAQSLEAFFSQKLSQLREKVAAS